jgi:hypothetical protein
LEKNITYFEQPGEENTNAVVAAVKTRAIELGIKEVVLASTTGKTGVAMASALQGTDIKTIVVTHQYGTTTKGQWDMEDEYVSQLNQMDAKIISASHLFSGIEKSLSIGTGGISRVEIIADILRKLFGKGFKVAVEVVLIAADSGAISMENDVVGIGGTAYGADVACVIRPAHSNNFYDLKIKEIIAMPREK